MKHLLILLIAGIAVLESTSLLYSAAPVVEETIPSVEEIERKAITYRLENTEQGYVRMLASDEISLGQKGESFYDITYDKSRIREIHRYRYVGETQWKSTEKYIITQEKYIRDVETANITEDVHVAPATNYKDPKKHYHILDPRPLGMDAAGTLALDDVHVEEFLNRSDRTVPTVLPDQSDGLKTWKIDYQLKGSETHVSIWIAPSQGFSVVQLELRYPGENGLIIENSKSQLKQYPVGNVWYPTRLVRTLSEKDRVASRQVVVVEEARFGGPIDETAFILAGLDLKPGRQVIDSTSGKPWMMVWDGKAEVKPSSVQTTPMTIPEPVRPWKIWLSLIGVVALALCAIFYFWRSRRSRQFSK